MSKVVSAPAVEIEFKDAQMLRLNPSLAKEIGLNESIVFLQIQFWIKGSNNVRDGQRWTYQTMDKMLSDAFPFLSRGTLFRTIHNLESTGLIIIGNYNTRKSDRTHWFALNVENARKLSAIIISQNGTSHSKMEQPYSNLEPSISQNGTTLPKDFPKTTHKNKNPVAQVGNPANYDEHWELFKTIHYDELGAPYVSGKGDWPMYTAFKKELRFPVDCAKWRHAVHNFFKSECTHTFTCFLKFYGACQQGIVDQYGKVVQRNESPKPTASRDMAVHSTDKDIEELNVVWAEMKAKSAARIH